MLFHDYKDQGVRWVILHASELIIHIRIVYNKGLIKCLVFLMIDSNEPLNYAMYTYKKHHELDVSTKLHETDRMNAANNGNDVVL